MPVSDYEIDRLRELTNVGAGHAATAFSQLAGRQILMSVPCLREPQAWSLGEDWPTGVFFELEGDFGGLVGILFRADMRDSLLKKLLGAEAQHPQDNVESALMEVGNILVSRVATAIADTLANRILPSVPMLMMSDAGWELERLALGRPDGGAIRIECELSDATGELGGLLVMFPDAPKVQ